MSAVTCFNNLTQKVGVEGTREIHQGRPPEVRFYGRVWLILDVRSSLVYWVYALARVFLTYQ